MADSHSLTELRRWYDEVPHTAVPSNVPYDTARLPAASEQRAAAKEAFMLGTDPWPAISYPKLESPSLDTSEHAYWKVLNGIITHEATVTTSGAVDEADVLYERAARKLAEVYRHMEVRRLGSTALHDRELSRQRAAEMSAELFGEPDPSTFRALLAEDVSTALAGRDAASVVRRRLADEYITGLGLTPLAAANFIESYSQTGSTELSDKAISVVSQDVAQIFPKLPEMIAAFQSPTEVSPADAKPAFEQAIAVFGLDRKGWKVVVTDTSEAAGTYSRQKEIRYGRYRRNFSPASLIGVPVHEALHALRAQNAAEQSLAARRGALPDSLAFDEGFCVAMEQVVTGEKRVGGRQYYIQLGLQLGLDGNEGQTRTFRQIYELMWRQRVLADTADPTGESILKHKDAAYRSVMRTMRGNSSDFRDISYFDGFSKAVSFLNRLATLPTAQRQADLRWVLSGVFDPTKPAHAKIYRS